MWVDLKYIDVERWIDLLDWVWLKREGGVLGLNLDFRFGISIDVMVIDRV